MRGSARTYNNGRQVPASPSSDSIPAAAESAPGRLISADRVRRAVEQRETPRRGLTPASLGYQLDDYRRGALGVTRLWDDIAQDDSDLALVLGKRRDSVGRARWEILVDEDTLAPGKAAEAQRHREVLQGFYSGLEAYDILAQDAVGGVGQLARYLLEAKAHGLAALNWIWKPGIQGKATTGIFQRCPPWWFENRTGKLRFLLSDYDVYGVEMEPRAWVSCAAPALMKPSCVLWLYKNLTLRDWLAFCEKFGMPGLVGETSAEKDSTEWVAFKEALAGFGQDFAMIVNEGAKITPITVGAAASAMPYQPLIEMLSRALYSLWLGGDLSSMSAQTGQGQGASLQQGEAQKIEDDDHRFVSEVCQRRIDREVIAYHFGPGSEPLAYFKLCPPVREDVDRELKVDEFFRAAGLAQERGTLYARYSRPLPEAVSGEKDGLVFTEAPATAAPVPGGRGDGIRPDGLANEDIPRGDGMQAILRAAARDLAPLRARLARIEQIEDPEVMASAMRRLLEELPRLARDLNADPAAARAIQSLITHALARGLMAKPGAPTPKAQTEIPAAS